MTVIEVVTLKQAGRKLIQQKYGGAYVKDVVPSSLKESGKRFVQAVYRNPKGGYSLKRKSGVTSTKDLIAKRLNTYYSKGGMRVVEYVYSSTSRRIRSNENMMAVRFKGGEKGWISADGVAVSEKDIRDILNSMDATMCASIEEVSLLDIYDSMTPKQKLDFAEKFSKVDWEAFWDELYPQEGTATIDVQYDTYMEMLYQLGKSADWDYE